MPLHPRDRRTIRAVILERSKEAYKRDGWECAPPRGDGYVMVKKRFPGNYEMRWMLDTLAERGVSAWVVGD